jgi:copper chaperone CopZ
MRTLISVENANCSYCMNAVRDELLARPLVHHVEMSPRAGCLEVEHDHDDPSALVGLLRQSLHGWRVTDNGEVVMVMTKPGLAHVCRHESPDEEQHA